MPATITIASFEQTPPATARTPEPRRRSRVPPIRMEIRDGTAVRHPVPANDTLPVLRRAARAWRAGDEFWRLAESELSWRLGPLHGLAVAAELDALLALLSHNGRRPLDFQAPGREGTSADERALFALIDGAKGGDWRATDAALGRFLPPGPARAASLGHARLLARTLAAAD